MYTFMISFGITDDSDLMKTFKARRINVEPKERVFFVHRG